MYARHRPNGPRGRSVIKLNGTYITLDGPTQAQQDSATEVYIGGHMYYVSDAIAAALIAAGYSVLPDTYTLYPLTTLYPSETLFPGYDSPVYP